MSILPRDFKEFLLSFNAHDVEYLLVGGWAVGFHGYPRATIDLDIWVRRSRENAEKIVRALADFGFDVPGLSEELFLEANQIIRMGVPPLRLEILTGIDGVRFGDCYPRRLVGELDGVSVPVITLEDLKTNKEAAGRPKDLADLEELP